MTETQPSFAPLRLVAASLFFVCVSGCASTMVRTQIPVAHIVEVTRSAPVEQALTLWARPVQLAQFDGFGEDEHGTLVPVAVRVPQDVFDAPPTLPPTDEPGLTGSGLASTFNRRTVPLLPFGAFWIELGNKSAAAITVQPSELELVLGTRRVSALADPGALGGRWRRVLDAMHSTRVGTPTLGADIVRLHRRLATLDRAITVSPQQTWRGYVVFDLEVFTADEYDALLVAAQKLEVRLRGERASVGFTSRAAPLDVVCLPRSPLDLLHCEALIKRTE